VTDPAAALAMTGATTLVAAMATSAWQTVRTRTAALFRRRGDSECDVQAALDRSAARLEEADGADGVRDSQVARWREEFVDLLRQCPETEESLRSLIAEVQPQLPPTRQQWVQNVTARDGGSAFGALGPGSSVNVHYHTRAGHQPPAPPADPGTGGTS